ncbi:AraC family transcriptional regulator [Pseudoxanthomonas sp. SE1]|uniref:helix-turn-helix domain-containing protein n=1 Tax=Pseudoxanthomonas sp. SE1 TaxID=1664560 RepID=UPI00240D00E1|nr:AraC family transcriptional regulator [Pseudoxanthomonas sp. SE1]WFC43515.1 AraC family transcriptional regulator [Pseudoxanthomonas sp. SE1]
MPADPARHAVTPTRGALPPILTLAVSHYATDRQRVAVPQVEAQVVVRFGPSIPGGVDIHAMGARRRVHRKLIRGGHRAVLARLQPGTYETVLGVSASELMGRTVPIEDLWGHARAQRLRAQLAEAPDMDTAGGLLEAAVAKRMAGGKVAGAMPAFLPIALEKLQVASVGTVARELGVSERHLRRVLHEVLGVGPKTYARLKRFEQAVRAAQSGEDINWSAIAADAGYYDQAHLIADFQAMAGCTPRRLLAELRETSIAS